MGGIEDFEGLDEYTGSPKPENPPETLSKAAALEQSRCSSCSQTAVDFRNESDLQYYNTTGYCQICQDEFDRLD